MVTSVEDDDTKLIGIAGDKTGASPHNLLADTLGDELKLATQGKSRVFGVSLKDRAAVLPGGFAADAAYWIDPQERCLGHIHLLSQRTPALGAGFQLLIVLPNIGIATGKMHRARCWPRPRIARAKTVPTPASTKSSAPRPSATNTNSSSPRNWSSTKTLAAAPPPICSRSAFRPTIFSATR